MSLDRIGVVVIGRNEGERLKRCLRSIPSKYQVVYVDSGSIDDSVEFAHSTGAIVVELDDRLGFTAARARNAGWRRLLDQDPDTSFVQFIDGDCEVAAGWFCKALSAIRSDDHLAIVFGRRRERFPERSIYNKLCDDEWDVPVGIVSECGGDALIRATALRDADGYSDDLIAGEEPDLCLRLSRFGWHVRRIDAEMTLHDANILQFSNWWKRAKRAGFAYAAHVSHHGAQSLPNWRRALMSIVFWGLALPSSILVVAAASAPLASDVAGILMAALTVLYLIQAARITWRKRCSGQPWGFSVTYGGLLLIGKFAQVSGVLRHWSERLFRRRQSLIEYK
ncbi:glycosyltransferase [Erythrobacter sp. sf7]|uniref:Glycosyltransferase n=2 Tax=Erythrobacter fulvus TaxID=2987523 RepID=A0ABT5JLH7_9SPHN|nr:glycosyltransferase [Erythrobacter fulvus]